jgi:ligand-binding sensor domain-containing protein
MNLILLFISLTLFSCQRMDTESGSFTPLANASEEIWVNSLTGDSIQPIINAFGDTVITGVAMPIRGRAMEPVNRKRTGTITYDRSDYIPLHSNSFDLLEELEVIPLSETQLTTIALNQNRYSIPSYVATNSSGDTIISGIPIEVTGKQIPAELSIPVVALEPRYLDDAVHDIQYLGKEQGLASPYIYKIIEDKGGNLWFGSDMEGLIRYDGEFFQTFTSKDGLPGNKVLSLLEDRSGNIWIGTEGGGVCRYDGANFIVFGKEQGLPFESVISLMEDRSGNLWFGSFTGLTKYDGYRFTHYTVKEGLPNEHVWSILEDAHGDIWLGTSDGLTRFSLPTDSEDGLFTHFDLYDNQNAHSIRALLEDRNGNIWIGGPGGICRMKPPEYGKGEASPI